MPSSRDIFAGIEKSNSLSTFTGFPVLTPGDTPLPCKTLID